MPLSTPARVFADPIGVDADASAHAPGASADGAPLPASGLPRTIPVTRVAVSPTTSAENPGFALTDGDYATGWGLALGETRGWAELTLEKDTLICGLTLTGYPAGGDRLAVSYFHDGGWISFTGGRASAADFFAVSGELFLPLSRERAVTRKLRVTLSGPGGGALSEIKIIGIPADEVFHRMTPVALSASGSFSPFSPPWLLADRNTRSGIRPRPITNGSGDEHAATASPAVLKKMTTFLDGYRPFPLDRLETGPIGPVRIVFHLAPGSRVGMIRFFLTPGGRGTTMIETADQHGWRLAAAVPAGEENGWHSLVVGGDATQAVDTKAVRVTLPEEGVITECEIWGYGAYEGTFRRELFENQDTAPFRTLIPDPDNPAAGTLPIDFYDDETDPFSPGKRIEFLCAGEIQTPLLVTVNGRILRCVPSIIINGHTLYALTVPADVVRKEKNYLGVGIDPRAELENEPVRVEGIWLADIPDAGEQAAVVLEEQSAACRDQSETLLALEQPVILDTVELVQDEDAAARIFYLQNDRWIELAGRPESDGRIIRFSPWAGGSPVTERLLIQRNPDGSAARVRLWGSPMTAGPPVVRLLAPSGKEAAWDTDSSVIGTVDDPDARVTVNGRETERRGCFFLIDLNEIDSRHSGKLELTALARDAEGRLGRSDALLVYPGQDIFSLDPAADVVETAEETCVVSGSVVSGLTAVFVNGRQIPVARKRFSAAIPLEPGANSVEISAYDPSTKRTGIRRLLLVRTVRPLSLSIDRPAPGLATGEDSLI
ncbi:MAG TPA: hypothetical protein ENN69_07515, partial [Spirochaetia bacterium]|nr:hypothetical protein [Spirochaetia bacterium]